MRRRKKERAQKKKRAAMLLFFAVICLAVWNWNLPVRAAVSMDKDDFETVEEWEAYQETNVVEEQDSSASGISTRMASEEETGQSTSRVPSTHLEVSAKLRYTITNLPIGRAIQKTYIDDEYIYVTQRLDEAVYLSRCKISSDRTTAVCQDWMLLQNFGHGQTLDFYTYNGTVYVWTSCGVNMNYAMRWSTEIGRMEYQPGVTISSKKALCRFTNADCANENGTSFGTLKRTDAALSEDGTKLIIWTQNTDNEIQYSIYDAQGLNQLLDKKETASSKGISFQNNESLKALCLGTLYQKTEAEKTLPNGSFQGIALSGSDAIYLTGGAVGETPSMSVLTKTADGYQFERLITITNSAFNDQTEVEGMQILGNEVYFGVCDHSKKENEQYIYSISKKTMTQWMGGHDNVTIENTKTPTCTKKGYTGDVRCQDCDRTLLYGSNIAAAGHSYGTGVVTKKATAVKTGTKTYTCTVCGTTKKETIKAKGAPSKGTKLTKENVTYKVMKSGKKNGTVRFMKTTSKASFIKIPATVSIDGITYRVTSVASDALKNNKKITSLSIGKNVSYIGSKAFYGCTKLKKITILSTKLTSKNIGSSAFAKGYQKVKVKVPKSKKKAYRILLRKKGISKKAEI